MSIPASWRPNGDPVANPRSDTTCRTGRSASQSSAVMRWMVVRSIDVARTTLALLEQPGELEGIEALQS